jgi:hypothetical protein
MFVYLQLVKTQACDVYGTHLLTDNGENQNSFQLYAKKDYFPLLSYGNMAHALLSVICLNTMNITYIECTMALVLE